MPNIKLVSNHDGTYDILIKYSKNDVEFASEFDDKRHIIRTSKKISETIKSHAKKAKIKSVKIFVSGVMVTSIAFSSLFPVLAATDRYSMGYLYSGTDLQQIEFVNQTNNALDTVSPSYFDLQENGSLKLNYLSEYLIDSMHEKGIKVVPFLSNHWNRTAGVNALKDIELLSTQLADYIEQYNLDGVNVDIENVTHEHRDQYTQLVRLLRGKIPEYKEISVAVAANPNDWQVGWHGSYDYTELAKYADHLIIMAYDEHHEGGQAGPVSSIEFVENSVKYALTKTTSDKIVVGIPLYGRVWSLDNDRIKGKGISSKTIQDILNSCDATITYDEKTQSAKAEFTITETNSDFTVGGDFVLQPGNYVVWYENNQSYQEKLSLIEKYDLKGVGSWSLGQEDPSIWNHYDSWLNGEAADDINPDPSVPSTPNQPTIPPTDDSTPNPPAADDTPTPNPPTTDDTPTPNPPAADDTPTPNPPAADDTPTPNPPAADDTATPNPPAADDINSSTAQEYFIYEIKAGDTLWDIAQTYLGDGTQYSKIMDLNKLTTHLIYPGTQLKIPRGLKELKQYTVKQGDTLWEIANIYLGSGVRYTEIKELNKLTSNLIFPGQILKLPQS